MNTSAIAREAQVQEQEQEQLVEALQDPAAYPHPVQRVRTIETHISYVLLTGSYAYKIKKAVELGFLDFTSLEKRHLFCDEELRLNRRLAPELYLDVVPIGGTPRSPKLGSEAGVFEYAVKMREFPQEGLLDQVLARGELSERHVDAIAAVVAAFHRCAEHARLDQKWGGASSVEAPMRQNFDQIRASLETAEEQETLAALRSWSLREHKMLSAAFEERHASGFVRECHGDLHLGNIALVDGQVRVFDCIEFDPNLRWIDVINEIAFLIMDFEERGRADYAARFLDAYLQDTGDYAGLRLLRYYQVYRALVRAKVAHIRASQSHLGETGMRNALSSYRVYFEYALKVIRPQRPALIITHGLSGSGKTTISQVLLESLGAVRVRSDVERKRLRKVAPLVRTHSALGEGLYDEAATRATYDELGRVAKLILDSGRTAIVDAAFLKRSQRDGLRRLAEALGVPFVIASCYASDDELRNRLRAREEVAGDASEATLEVLQHQQAHSDPLGEDERLFAVTVDNPIRCAHKVQERITTSTQGELRG